MDEIVTNKHQNTYLSNLLILYSSILSKIIIRLSNFSKKKNRVNALNFNSKIKSRRGRKKIEEA